MAKPRWGFARLRTWKRCIVRADIGLPRRCEADAWEEETQAERSSRKERSGGHAGFAATRARSLPREKAENECEAEGVERAAFLQKKRLPRRTAAKTSRFLFVMAHEFERLCDLHHDDGHDGKPDADGIEFPRQIFEVEHRHDARREHDERDERERDERDDVEELVRERPHFEEGVPRTHVVGVER